MTISVDIRTDRPRNTVLRRALFAGAVAAGVGCLVGPAVAEATRLLVLASAFEHRWPSFLVAVVLLAAAVRLLTDRPAVRRRVLAVCAAAVIGVVWFRMVAFPVVSPDWQETSRTAAPGGENRYLVVEEGSVMIDPLWRVSVVDGWGVTARQWPVGLFDGDTADRALMKVAWSGPDALAVTTGDGEVRTVRLDPGNGKPERELSVP
ncbi:hypothetical protein [Streptomyces sp. WAC01280]|uniref:hypothetical protein n=1 Tax=Streptomyces sp. WAC01280 TaxID=2487424 RepID=UPI000F78074C|nr:hypothetical protein [Streptomyces sp. WAC01280]RSS59526.1 hypothetical protein EF909_06510 [Streptomyces sp. WAC01280]